MLKTIILLVPLTANAETYFRGDPPPISNIVYCLMDPPGLVEKLVDAVKTGATSPPVGCDFGKVYFAPDRRIPCGCFETTRDIKGKNGKIVTIPSVSVAFIGTIWQNGVKIPVYGWIDGDTVIKDR